MLSACSEEAEWPARIAAAVYAGVDHATAHPEVTTTLVAEWAAQTDSADRYEVLIARLAGFLQLSAPPTGRRLPGSTDEALVAGIVGLVGDHLRLGRKDRLLDLRPDLVLLTLLPYLGFSEAQEWANRYDERQHPG